MSRHGAAAPNANVQPSFYFSIEIDNIKLGAFESAEVDGMEWTTIENRTGIDPPVKQITSGLRKTSKITLKKNLREGGKQDVMDLNKWFLGGSNDKRGGAIVQLDHDLNEIARATFTDGFISKFEIPQNDANSDDGIATFTVEIAVSKVDLE